MPRPNKHSIMVQMFGFGYTQFGIAHDLNEVDYADFRLPSKAPDVMPNVIIRDDADLDQEFL